jgi:hypothetical protein
MSGGRLTPKSVFFLSMKTINPFDKLASLYVKKVIILHGVPKFIVSNHDPSFNSHLWPSIQHALKIKLNFSMTFHPQING